ncbi:MAG: precorrin-6y C5,15-methyltransferase (decarboxylating) subunit CbiE [Rhodospirillales bacterium]|nr:precorrin-6y C5,15-methyltransferase (decarboxylating) subunit CbiE [Rhodospirillales bacterium]MDE0382002.1 precorrin-6y C5,15-methyltransferase (decarboxylating) subunit CbiE [Rhodospirillales bacterium]
MSGWLTVIGIGEEGPDALAPAARALIEQAEVLIGGARHLAMIPDGHARRMTWRSPLADTMDDIRAAQGRRVVVLATGDPFCFGIGTTLRRAFPEAGMLTIPAPSAFTLARARLGWSAEEVVGVTLHGRALETIRAHLAPGQRLLVLSHDGATPAQVAAQLTAVGYGASRLTVLAHMGGSDEARVSARADGWSEARVADLNTIAVECRAEGRVKRFRGAPGLPDRAFENDGQLTKREIRVQTLSALDPRPHALLWDVGAGAGSVAIEWLLSERTANAIAVERDGERCARIARNAAALGVPRLQVQQGAAPEALERLPVPDAVFVGGGLALPGLIETCWARLAAGGVLVANAVTLAGEAVLAEWAVRHEGTLTRLAVSRARPVGSHLAWRPLMPVTQLALIKGEARGTRAREP